MSWWIRVSTLSLLVSLASVGPARAGNGKRALGLLPADTALVISVNTKGARKSPLYPHVGRAARINADVSRALALIKSGAGFGVPGSVDTVVIGLAADFDRSAHITVVLEGAIDANKVDALVASYPKAVKRLVHNRVRYYRIDGLIDAVILRRSLVLTNKGRAKALIDLARARGVAGKLTGNRSMMAMIAATDTGKHAWGVFAFPSSVRASLAKALPAGKTLTGVSVSLDAPRGLSAKLRIMTSSATMAQTVVAAAMLGKSTLADRKKLRALGLSAVVRSSNVTRRGNDVDLAVRLDAKQLKQLVALLSSI
jgi:hypothetical protein